MKSTRYGVLFLYHHVTLSQYERRRSLRNQDLPGGACGGSICWAPDDPGGCYLAEAGGRSGWISADEVQTERSRSSGGSGGGEWTEPLL